MYNSPNLARANDICRRIILTANEVENQMVLNTNWQAH